MHQASQVWVLPLWMTKAKKVPPGFSSYSIPTTQLSVGGFGTCLQAGCGCAMQAGGGGRSGASKRGLGTLSTTRNNAGLGDWARPSLPLSAAAGRASSCCKKLGDTQHGSKGACRAQAVEAVPWRPWRPWRPCRGGRGVPWRPWSASSAIGPPRDPCKAADPGRPSPPPLALWSSITGSIWLFVEAEAQHAFLLHPAHGLVWGPARLPSMLG